VFIVCSVSSCLYDELITRSKDSYRFVCVCVCVSERARALAPNFVRIRNLKMWRLMPYLFRSATENNSSFARNLGVLETDDRAASILYVGTHYVCSLVSGTCTEPV